MTLEAHHNEVVGDELVEVRLLDEARQPLHSQQVGVRWFEIGDAYPLFAPTGTPIAGWPLPHPGLYRFEVRRGDRAVEGGLEFHAVPAPGSRAVPAKSKVRATGFKLEYAHLAYKVEAPSGVLVIENITDFYPARQSGAGVFNGFHISAITGGRHDGDRHRYRIEMLDSDGRSLRRFDEATITFNPAGPGHLLGALNITVLRDVIFPRIGEYEFVLFVDGRRIGSSEFIVIPAPAGPSA